MAQYHQNEITEASVTNNYFIYYLPDMILYGHMNEKLADTRIFHQGYHLCQDSKKKKKKKKKSGTP